MKLIKKIATTTIFLSCLSTSIAYANIDNEMALLQSQMQSEIDKQVAELEESVKNSIYSTSELEAFTFGVKSKRVKIDIPYTRCTKTFKRISFHIPKIEMGTTRILGIKIHGVPKIYRKSVDLSWDYPKCSKANKRISFDIPEFFDAKSKMKKSAKTAANVASKGQEKINQTRSKYMSSMKVAGAKGIKQKFSSAKTKIKSTFAKLIAEQNRKASNAKNAKQKESDLILAKYLKSKLEIELEELKLQETASIKSLTKSLSI